MLKSRGGPLTKTIRTNTKSKSRANREQEHPNLSLDISIRWVKMPLREGIQSEGSQSFQFVNPERFSGQAFLEVILEYLFNGYAFHIVK